jgi:rhamnosyltransferase
MVRIVKFLAQARLLLWHAKKRTFSFRLFKKERIAYTSRALAEPKRRIPGSDVVVVAHVFYLEYVSALIEMARNLPTGVTYLVTTPHASFCPRISSGLKELGVPHTVRVCQNKGRDIGALLVEFSPEVQSFEFIIHVHSKLSKHSDRKLVRAWVARCESLLMTGPGVENSLSLLANNPDVGLVFPDVSDLVSRFNFYWGLSLDKLRSITELQELIRGINPNCGVLFPAGSMFLARTSAIKSILDVKWDYGMFPNELGQVDGQVHHGIERLFGFAAEVSGFKVVGFLAEEKEYWTRSVNLCSD